MTTIRISYVNELKMQLEVERSIAYELRERFSFFAKNYKYMPAYKNSNWDGKISLFDGKTRTMFTGLLPNLFQFAKENDYTIEFDNINDFKTRIKLDENWIEKEFLSMGKFEPKFYQEGAFTHAIKNNKSLILSPTGSGKSYIIYMIVRYLLQKTDEKILVNVPSINLVEQLYSDLEDYVVDDFIVADNVTKSYGKTEENLRARVVIQTWQTSQHKPADYFEQFGAYICDEAHSADAKVLTKIIEMLGHAIFRVGLTGTLNGTNLHELEMLGRFGKLYQGVTTAQLMDSGDLAMLEIDCLNVKYTLDESKKVTRKTTSYQQEIDFLLEHKNRNKLLINLAMKQQKNTLMLFNYVERHGMLLLDDLNKVADKNLKTIHFIYGKVDGEDREQIRLTLDKKVPLWYDIYLANNEYIRVRESIDVMLSNGDLVNAAKVSTNDKLDKSWLLEYIESDGVHHTLIDKNATSVQSVQTREGCAILLASYGTLAVGVNIKKLHCLIFCHPLKAPIRLLQSIGRILRACEGKSKVKLIDIVDDLTYMRGKTKQQNIVYRHFIERLKIYEDSKFKYKIVNITL